MKIILAVIATMALGDLYTVNSSSSQDGSTAKKSAQRQNDHVKVNSPELNLSPDFVITSTPQTRNYVFEITEETAAMDGFERSVATTPMCEKLSLGKGWNIFQKYQTRIGDQQAISWSTY